MAIAVDDDEQGRGIETTVFELLSHDARRKGIRRFLAVVLGSNQNMLNLLQGLGFKFSRIVDRGEIEVDVELREEQMPFWASR
jgi:ribosomal protein S18 acetylase RimI-like enzyme